MPTRRRQRVLTLVVINLARMTGIEPASLGWKPSARASLPHPQLLATRMGFEPMISTVTG